jgi:hypothetical protein
MGSTIRAGRVLALAAAMAIPSCGGALPQSPAAPSGNRAAATLATRIIPHGSEGGYDEPAPVEEPSPEPMPEPTPDPPSDGGPAPVPIPFTIEIVGTAGTQAFEPNPAQPLPGDSIVWSNRDRTAHHIVLDDGTDVGVIAPGRSTDPIVVTSATSYRCIIHPSMTGRLGEATSAGDPSPGMPTDPPPYDPPPYDPPPYDYYSHR